jgi:splicing factor 3B subunit 3
VTSLGLAQVPEGLQRSRFLAVGCSDDTVRIVSLDPSACLQPASMQALPATPSSLVLTDVTARDGGVSTLYLYIGLANGVLLRSVVDDVTGSLSDTRTR